MSAPALVGHTKHFQGSATSNSIAYTPTAIGNSILILCTNNTGNEAAVASDNNASYTWTTDFASASGSGNAFISAFRTDNITVNAANTFKVSFNATCSSQIFVLEVSGLLLSGSFDTSSAIKGANSAAPSTNTAAPSQNGEYAVMFIGSTGATTPAVTSGGFTQEDSASSGPSGAWGDQVLASTAAVSGGGTLSGANPWSAIVLLYKAAVIPAALPTPLGGLPRVQWHWR